MRPPIEFIRNSVMAATINSPFLRPQLDEKEIEAAVRIDDYGPLYAARKKVYPQSVSGTFRRIKWELMAFCLGVYYVLPFVRWNRGLGAPDQAVLVDLGEKNADKNRRPEGRNEIRCEILDSQDCFHRELSQRRLAFSLYSLKSTRVLSICR
jgi:hypothetical protein